MINGDFRITKNFLLSEFVNTKDGNKIDVTPEFVTHVQMLQIMRNLYGKPMHVSSGYRTKEFNKSCGGDKNSAHLDGLATDVDNIPASYYSRFTEWWRAICECYGRVGGINYYSWGVHLCSNEDRFGAKSFIIRDKR